VFAYRVGFPGWKIAARLGFMLKVRVEVLWDDEAKVFVARSDDFLPDFGCVAESATWDGLKAELNSVFEDAFESIFGKPIKHHQLFDANLRFAHQ
jgi:hypothetical protein